MTRVQVNDRWREAVLAFECACRLKPPDRRMLLSRLEVLLELLQAVPSDAPGLAIPTAEQILEAEKLLGSLWPEDLG